jgi:hypothetical protein
VKGGVRRSRSWSSRPGSGASEARSGDEVFWRLVIVRRPPNPGIALAGFSAGGAKRSGPLSAELKNDGGTGVARARVAAKVSGSVALTPHSAPGAPPGVPGIPLGGVLLKRVRLARRAVKTAPWDLSQDEILMGSPGGG